MEDKKNTRQQLADSLRELMRVRSFDHITVRDIVDHCGVGRQTFYYYFQDKYDLMNWIYTQETRPYVEQVEAGMDWADGLTEICRLFWREKGFYRSLLREVGPNTLSAFLRELAVDLAMVGIRRLTESRGIDAERLRFTADFCAIALVGMLNEWAERGMKEDPAVFVQKMREILRGSVQAEIQHPGMPKF